MVNEEICAAHDALAFSAWAGLIHYAIKVEHIHRQFCADTGRTYIAPDTKEEERFMAEDGAVDIYTGDFARWATDHLWGSDDVTPSIQAVLDCLPRRQ